MAVLQMKFIQTDPAAKADISAIAPAAFKPWSKPDELRYDDIPEPGKYATLERDYWALDGTFPLFPDNPGAGNPGAGTWGLWSDALSGVYAIGSNIGVVREPVEGFRRIRLEFLTTNKPAEYVSGADVFFGVLILLFIVYKTQNIYSFISIRQYNVK